MVEELKKIVKSKKPHHAYCLISKDVVFATQKVWDVVSKHWGFARKVHSDVLILEKPTLVIEDSRRIQEWSWKMPEGDKRVCIIQAHNLTVEAQNSLLKIFEEPNTGTHFFLIISDRSSILPTLASRFEFVSVTESDDVNSESLSSLNFLKSDYAKRMEILKPIIDEKDTQVAYLFLSDLEKSLFALSRKNETTQKGLLGYSSSLAKKRSYLLDSSPSVKTVLESVIVTLPILK